MGFTVIPTNIGGVSLNSIAGPLASLIGGTPSAQIMNFPSDLGSNPSMGHAVIFQAYDYKTGLGDTIASTVEGAAFAGAYTPLTQGTPLATISLFMPETMAIQYQSTWDDVSLTKELGLVGKATNAISDFVNQGVGGVTPYAKAISANLLGRVGGDVVGGLAAQSLGVFTNPQLQLLYKGKSLRTFDLAFTLTPKTSSEAQTVKNICDSFAYFSLPGIAGAQIGTTGQFLTPPQVFKVQFQFLGGSGIGNQISNAISSALNNTGLNVLAGATGGSTAISGGTPSKTFTVNDCVLENVAIDYAPNGWATYNDGYPVQTTLTLSFKETTMYTKQNMKQTAVAANYNNIQQTAENDFLATNSYTLNGGISNDINDR
jgi:hypothetical protein